MVLWGAQSLARPAVLGARSLLLLSEFQELRGDIMLAEETLRYRCARCTVDFGSEDLVTQAAMADFEISKLRHGMPGQAVPVRDHPAVRESSFLVWT